MARNVVVVAPHPDVETLEPGGTILKHVAACDPVHRPIVTGITNAPGFPAEHARRRSAEIEAVAAGYPFTSVHRPEIPTSTLDIIPLKDLIDQIKVVLGQVNPSDL